MYPISPLYADYLRRPDREFFAAIDIDGVEYLRSAIVEFSIENSLTLSADFEIGTAIPAKLTMKLRTNEVIPPNARIKPRLSLSLAGMTWNEAVYPWNDMKVTWLGGGTDWLPLGEFYVDSRERSGDVWTFTCYDRLVFADALYVSALSYPASMRSVFNEICQQLGVTADSSVVINPAYQIRIAPTAYTMRQVLAYIAGVNAASVYMSKDGLIGFRRFAVASQPVFTMTSADYVQTKPTNPQRSFSRIVATYNADDELSWEAGSGPDSRTLFFENPFVTQAMVNDLQATLNGFAYQPVSMDARGFPQLEAGDTLTFERYEGHSWEETVTPWAQTEIPWNGINSYQTLILHQVLTYRGGLRMSIEAPSASEQQSEFQIEGTLSGAIKNLNKTAVKEGRRYYGASLTRSEGLVIDRDDELARAVFNADELSFYANGDHALWFDLPSRKFKFAGDLEAVGGTFSGNLQAAGGTFKGALQAASGTFAGNLEAVGGTFKGSLQAASGSFTGELSGATGTFSGSLQAASGTFKGRLEAATGSFSGRITASEIEGGMITGTLIRTAAAGARTEVTTAGIYSYDSSGQRKAAISHEGPSEESGFTVFGSGQRLGGFYSRGNATLLTSENQLQIFSFNSRVLMTGAFYFADGDEVSGLHISSVNGLQNELNNRAINLTYDRTTKNLKLWSVAGSLLAQVNLS